jgi:hypothetical protein
VAYVTKTVRRELLSFRENVIQQAVLAASSPACSMLDDSRQGHKKDYIAILGTCCCKLI